MFWSMKIGTAVAALAVAAGAGAGEGAGTGPPGAPAKRAACSPTVAAGVITDFFDAVNRGHARAAVEIMDPRAGPPNARPGGWYSLSEGDSRGRHRHQAFFARRALRRYFARRHGHGEQLRLIAIRAHVGNGRADFEFRVERHARDLRAAGIGKNRIAHGKGALYCGRRKIFVWSMVHPPRRPFGGPICPDGVVACSRRR
jgi:hypothetical protein